MGQVIEQLDLPAGITVTGLECDGRDQFPRGGGTSGGEVSPRPGEALSVSSTDEQVTDEAHLRDRQLSCK